MSVPAKRRTRGSKKRRASHYALKSRVFSACSHCKKPILPHHACPYCGYYKGREVVHIKLKKEKEKKKRQKEKKKKKKK